MEVIGVYFSNGGFIRKKYNIFVAVNNADKKELERLFEGISYSYHKTYGSSAELIFHPNKKVAKTIADKLKELEFNELGKNGYVRLLKALE